MMRTRRDFLKQCGATAGLAFLATPSRSSATTQSEPAGEESRGVLVDTTRCIGCRRCESACNTINTDLPRKDAESFRDEKVFDQPRRMDDTSYTVVNRCASGNDQSKPVYAKFQCMHCREPACVSACIVGALARDETGAVRYDAWKCIGCRYCMQACPFQVPAYEYGNALTPQVRKCTFCYDTRLSKGEPPACVQACPMEVMSFGPRAEVLALAKERIQRHPDRYLPRVYGEHEAGGTSWLYLSSIAFEDLGLPKLGYHPTPGYTEPIQHAIFKWFLPPLTVYAALGGIWWYMSKRNEDGKHSTGEA